MTTPITIRSPGNLKSTNSPNTNEGFTPPSVEWISGTWHVTHSSLPMWKKARNVSITYDILPDQKLFDTVNYQALNSPKIKTIRGIDTPAGPLGTYNWRGKGWLMIASSHWQILGYGDGVGGEQWVATYFEKTLFTPAGVDIYSRRKGGLSEALLGEIRGALKGCGDEVVKKLEADLFEVRRDDDDGGDSEVRTDL